MRNCTLDVSSFVVHNWRASFWRLKSTMFCGVAGVVRICWWNHWNLLQPWIVFSYGRLIMNLPWYNEYRCLVRGPIVQDAGPYIECLVGGWADCQWDIRSDTYSPSNLEWPRDQPKKLVLWSLCLLSWLTLKNRCTEPHRVVAFFGTHSTSAREGGDQRERREFLQNALRRVGL